MQPTRAPCLVAALAVLAAAGAGIDSASAQQTYVYTATLDQPSARSGAVVAAGITWQCQANACTTSGPWPLPGIIACAALRAQVGRVVAYGREGAQLGAPGLARCNGPALPNLTRGPPVLRRTIPPASTPAPAPEPTPAPVDGVIDTSEIFVVGGAYTAPPPDIGPVTIAAREIFIVGGVYAPPGADRAPVTIDTPEVFVVGAGPPLPNLTHGPTPHAATIKRPDYRK